MAHLDIQKKRTTAWLWPLLALIAVALIAWWLLAGDDEPDVVGVDPVVTAPVPPMPSGEGTRVITDLSTLTRVADPASMMGNRVALTGVPVSDVVSDKGFWIGSGTGVGEGVFAVRSNTALPSTPPDGAVNPGDRLTLFGVVTAMPANLNDRTAQWSLRSTDAEVLAAHRFYIHVDSLRPASP